MFYSQFILAKKGPLGTIWIAAHLERKLRKNQVAETDIGVTVDSILFPEVPIALRLSGHLLLGVVRIYSRQVNYLFNDCSETLGKIKQAFHSAAVDLPPEATTAPFHTITLPETFDFDELELVPDSESSYLHRNGNYVDPHVTTREQITLQDSVDHNPYLGSSQFGLDERFDDGSYFPFGLDFDEEFLAKKGGSPSGTAGTSTPLLKEDTIEPPSGTEGASTPLPKEDIMVPSVGCETEVMPMDIDDHCQPVKSGHHEIDPLGERAKAVPEVGSLEMESHANAYAPEAVCEVDGLERDSQSNAYYASAISIHPLNEHADSQVSLRKGLDFAYLKHGGSVFNAYTPRPLEACTPDLNQEYCPPDEPSTPALVDETSLPMYQELTVETAGRFSPVFLGHPERTVACETLPVSLQGHQVNPLVSANEAFRSPNGALFQGLTLNQSAPVEEINRGCFTPIEIAQIAPVKDTVASMSNASPSFPSLPQQASLQQSKTDVSLRDANFLANASYSLLASSAAASPQLVDNPASFVTNQWGHILDLVVSTPNQQQGLAVGHNNPKTLFGVGMEPSSFGLPGMVSNTVGGLVSTASIASPTSINPSPLAEPSGFGLPGMVSNTMGGMVSTASIASPTSINPSPLAEPSGFGLPGMVSNTMVGQMSTASIATPTSINLSPLASSVSCLPMQNVLSPLAEPSSFGLPGMVLNTMAGQMSTASIASPTSINLSPLVSSESYLPMQNVRSSGQMMPMDVEKNLAATQGQLWRSVGQQLNPSSFAVMGPLMSPRNMEECETLRSAYNLQSSSPNFAYNLQSSSPNFGLLQKDMSDDRLPGLQLSRNKAFSSSMEGATKELLLPELDKTPILTEETPFTAARASVLSMPNLGSEPGDDDVLASILGQRTKVFKVIPTVTPKAPKPPKVIIAPKRPKLVSRATPKRRKVDLDSVAVLHGDVIRQQLANAEDIRRERRKAPCTRREVWGFLRECEGQENFDEPALPELPSNLHEIYHYVVHGRGSPLSGAPEVKEVSEAKLFMGGRGSCLSDGVKSHCMEVESAGESDLLAHYVKKISAKDALPSQAVGSIENHSSETCAEQLLSNEGRIENHSSEKCVEQLISNQVVCLSPAVINGEGYSLENPLEESKEHRKAETAAEQDFSVGLTETCNVDMSRAAELFMLEVGTELLAGKEGQLISFPEAQSPEAASSIAITETIVEEQAVQAIELEREFEVVEHLQDVSMVSNFSEGVQDSNADNQDVAMVGQQDIVNTDNQRQPSSHLHEQDFHEGQLLLPSQDTNLQPVDITSSGKDSTELPVLQAAAVVDNGNIEGGDSRLPTVVSEEGVNVCRNDDGTATMEPERDTDCLDEDNDAAYAEIDYSSDEQDVSVQDDSGWSTRSRNVGKYLKTVFEEMQSSSKRLDQGANLGLERLLARRTRREAARMFFETLVLKTKDYIHVEQNVPYQDVMLYPKSKLMKTEF